MKNNSVHVALLFDHNMVRSALITAASCLRYTTSSRTFVFHLFLTESAVEGLDRELPAFNSWCAKERHVCEIVRHVLTNEKVGSYPSNERLSAMSCLKIDIANLIGEVDRFLLMDVDMMATDDVVQIYDMELTDVPLAAVEDLCIRGAGGSAYKASIGLPPERPVFNAGLLLVNTSVYKSLGIAQKTTEILLSRAWHLLDQDALNVAFYQHGWPVGRLEDRWNWVELGVPYKPEWSRFIHPRQSLTPSARGVLHFCGRSKPWKRFCHLRDRFVYRAFAKTVFPDFDLQNNLTLLRLVVLWTSPELCTRLFGRLQALARGVSSVRNRKSKQNNETK